jgi:hypothetical protein
MRRTIILFSLLVAGVSPAMGVEPPPGTGKKIFVVNDYRFDERSAPAAPVVAKSLCSTRCNALSADYDSYAVYMMRGEWRLQRVATAIERVVSLDSPYLAGQCICVGDEYLVEPYVSPGSGPPLAQKQSD